MTRVQLIRLLESLGENDVVAIYTPGTNLNILHDFTTGARSLAAKAKQDAGKLVPVWPSVRELQRTDAMTLGPLFGSREPQIDSAFSATLRRGKAYTTMNSLELIARHMAGLPGRKNLIWLSAGFPLSIANLGDTNPANTAPAFSVINAPAGQARNPADTVRNNPVRQIAGRMDFFVDDLERSLRNVSDTGVSVYGLDVSGLSVPLAQAESGFGSDVANAALARVDLMRDGQSSLIDFAERTGGVVTFNANDLTAALRQAFEDSRRSYTIGYYTSDAEFNGKFRKIQVKVRLPGVKLRRRDGCAACSRNEAKAANAKEDIEHALRSPVTQTAVRLTAKVGTPNPQEIGVVLQADTRQVGFDKKDGVWTAGLDLVFSRQGQQGQGAAAQSSIPLKLSGDQYRQAMEKGLLSRRTLARDPAASYLRIVVRDANSGAIGTLGAPLAATGDQ